MLDKIKECLSFKKKNCLDFFIKVNLDYKKILKSKFNDYLASINTNYSETIIGEIEKLNYRKIDDFLEFPTISNIIFNEKNWDDEINFSNVYKGLKAEVAFLENNFDLSRSENYLWTSDGSYLTYFDGKKFKQFISPKIGNSIPVDNYSPSYFSFTPEAINEYEDVFVDYEIEDLLDQVNVINESYDRLPKNHKIFIEIYIKSFMLKKLVGKSKKTISSCSDGDYIGRIAFVNSHKMSDWFIMESLIHEAIHGFIFQLNKTTKFITTYVKNDLNFKSPWTGNSLTLYNLIEAIHVWYAIYQYHIDFGISEFDEKVSNERTNWLKKGFEKLDLKSGRIKNSVQSTFLDYLLVYKKEIIENEHKIA
ncbi:MAG: hypothetical protein CR985_01660 [Flavobacteriales bacterium]|nr:MAG: hypothetical protein CR985_01660 [Flavobacteriales bacterium]